jgi:hypothetical protein
MGRKIVSSAEETVKTVFGKLDLHLQKDELDPYSNITWNN